MTGLVTGLRADETRLRTLARQARIAFTDAQAAIGLASSEPHRGDTDLEATAKHSVRCVASCTGCTRCASSRDGA